VAVAALGAPDIFGQQKGIHLYLFFFYICLQPWGLWTYLDSKKVYIYRYNICYIHCVCVCVCVCERERERESLCVYTALGFQGVVGKQKRLNYLTSYIFYIYHRERARVRARTL
jgi:hypothetical protein